MRFVKDESGQALVLVALSLVAILGFAGLAIDVGQLRYTQLRLQTAADAAALAAAMEIQQCGGTSNCSAMQNAAKSAVTENGLSSPTILAQCAAGGGTGLALTINNGPCALGAKDPNYNNTKFTEAVLSQQQPMFFARVLGIGSLAVSARAEAALGASKVCLGILNPTASQALLLNGSASLTSSCGIVVDSSSSTALLANGSVKLTAPFIHVHGGDLLNGSPSISPAPITGVGSMPDPLADLPVPTIGSCGTTSSSPFTGSPTQALVSSSQTAVFNPGRYCGGITINGSATATFNPGLYIVDGSMIVNGGDTVSGSGVTFYFSSGSLTMNGSSNANLIAPTTGTYAGILIFQSSTDTNSVIVNGNSKSVWQGTLYAPGAQLILNGGSNLAAYTIVIVNTVIVNGTDTFTLGNDYSSLPGGSPIQGSTAVLME
jgi:Flp pilus assembly protein TadG